MLSIQKILIVRFSSLGDILLTSPLIRVLRAAFPKSQIDFVVKSEFAELVRFNHHLSSVIELKSSSNTELRALKSRIRQERYDIILDLHNSLRSRYLRLFSGAKSLAVVNKRIIQRFFLIHFKWNFYEEATPVAERYLKTARHLGIQNDGKGLELFIPDEVQFSIASLMGKYRLDRYDSVVGIAPAARHNTKMWPHDRFARVAAELVRRNNTKVFLFGGNEEVALCDAIMGASITALARGQEASSNSDAMINLAGKLSLLQTAAALDFCDAVLCNDTGIMHLAAARQRNVVSIFGPTVQEFGFFPYRTNSLVLEQKNLYCRPCTHIGSRKCPEGHFRCMNDTSTDTVVSALNEMILDHSSVR